MIRDIISKVNNKMSYTFKDVLIGLVHPHLNKRDVIPKSSDGKTYPEAVPDGTKKSIVYWEDYGGKTIDACSRYRRVSHTVRIVVWLNFNKIETTFDDCVKEILRTIPRKVGTTTVSVTDHLHKDSSLFSRYTYDEGKQYITYPYDVFAFMVDVKYMDTLCSI